MEEIEIVLPETKPETEWVRGRALRKVSPRRSHARVQMRIASALDAWAADRGEVATEWRFRIAPLGEARRPLVPDVAFVAEAKLRGHTPRELEVPAFAPTVAIEVLSPTDRAVDVAAKISDYLRGGSDLVVVLDPERRTATLHESGRPAVTLAGEDVLNHERVLPGFALPLARFYDEALGRRKTP